MRAAALILFALLASRGLTPPAAAQQAGERVMITATTETKIRAEKVDQVYLGQIKTVTAVEGKWCSVDGVRGWLPLQHAVPLATALRTYDQRVRQNPRDTEALTMRGNLQLELGQLERAFDDFNRALQVDRKLVVAWNNRAMVEAAQGKTDEALRDVSHALALNPQYVDGYVNRAMLLAAAGRLSEALRDFDHALALDPENALHWVRRGAARFEAGHADGAWADFQRALELNPRLAGAYVGRGNVQLHRGELDAALADAEQALKLDPKNAEALNLKGWLHFESQAWEAALESFNQAIQHQPGLAIAYSNRGVLRCEQGDYRKAIADFDQALQLDDGGALTWCNRATAWMNLEEFARAQQDFEKSLELAPRLPEVCNAYAWFLATAGDDAVRDGARAVTLAQQAVDSGGGKNWYYWDTLAAAFAESGDFARAEETQQRAIEAAPEKQRPRLQARLEQYRQQQPLRREAGKTAGQ